MSERLWLLRGQVHCVEDFLDGLGLCDEREDFNVSPTEGTQQRVNFVNFLDHLCPTEPALSVRVAAILSVLVVFRGIFDAGLSPAFCAGGVCIIPPVSDELLSGFGDMVGDSCDELEDIPSCYPG